VVVSVNPCWKVDVDITTLRAFLEDEDDAPREVERDQFILRKNIRRCFANSGLQFIPTNTRDASAPFPVDVTPKAVAVLDYLDIPLWLFGESKWTLYICS
jgi:hypothetical protein